MMIAWVRASRHHRVSHYHLRVISSWMHCSFLRHFQPVGRRAEIAARLSAEQTAACDYEEAAGFQRQRNGGALAFQVEATKALIASFSPSSPRWQPKAAIVQPPFSFASFQAFGISLHWSQLFHAISAGGFQLVHLRRASAILVVSVSFSNRNASYGDNERYQIQASLNRRRHRQPHAHHEKYTWSGEKERVMWESHTFLCVSVYHASLFSIRASHGQEKEQEVLACMQPPTFAFHHLLSILSAFYTGDRIKYFRDAAASSLLFFVSTFSEDIYFFIFQSFFDIFNIYSSSDIFFISSSSFFI